MSQHAYLQDGAAEELERLQLLVTGVGTRWPAPSRHDGRRSGARVLDAGCGAMGWLRLLSEWVGPDGHVVGTDIDDAMLAAAGRFVANKALGNVTLVTTTCSPASWNPPRSTWCTPGSNWLRWGADLSRWRPTCVWSAPAAPSYWKSWTPAPGTSSHRRPHSWCISGEASRSRV
jgi:hypothetical protein